MSAMIPVDNYDASYIDDRTRDWHPCRVVGVTKGEKATAMEFVILITKHGVQKIERVESVRVGAPPKA